MLEVTDMLNVLIWSLHSAHMSQSGPLLPYIHAIITEFKIIAISTTIKDPWKFGVAVDNHDNSSHSFLINSGKACLVALVSLTQLPKTWKHPKDIQCASSFNLHMLCVIFFHSPPFPFSSFSFFPFCLNMSHGNLAYTFGCSFSSCEKDKYTRVWILLSLTENDHNQQPVFKLLRALFGSS